MTYIIERFEDNGWAVLERDDSETFNIPLNWLHEEVQEGDVLSLELSAEAKASTLSFTLDDEETARRRLEAKARWDSLPKGPEGDIEL